MRRALALGSALLVVAAHPGIAGAAPSRVSVGGARVTEGDGGVTRATFTLRRSAPVRGAASVRFATANGSATAGADYVRKAGTVRFRRGQRRRTFAVAVRGDTLDEPDETFVVRLSRPRGLRLRSTRGKGTIVDDDAPPPTGGGESGGGSAGGGSAGGGSAGGGSQGPQVVRFIAVGDTGKGNTEQSQVAAAMQAKCAASGCDYIVGLGDNIYDSGASSVDDPQFQTKFEMPYASINLPFWMLLGQADYGSGTNAFPDAGRAQVQVDYTAKSAKWRMPAKYYRRSDKQVDFFTLDTTPIQFGTASDQQGDIPAWLGQSTATWKIALGHHTYRSNGPHGNAGNYDGITGITIPAGKHVKDFIEANVCGKADLYISGHDHSLQWPSSGPNCAGTELIVSGAGSSTTTLPGTNTYNFQSASLGFVYIAITDRQLTAEFINSSGTTLYTRTISK